jgi:probable addiction module antidote protein
MVMVRETRPWDAAELLGSKADIAAYLDAVLEEGDPVLLKAALGDVARAKGMTEIARAAGLGRASLYKALSPDGNPELATVAKVLRALGLRLKITPEVMASPGRKPRFKAPAGRQKRASGRAGRSRGLSL